MHHISSGLVGSALQIRNLTFTVGLEITARILTVGEWKGETQKQPPAVASYEESGSFQQESNGS